MTMSAAEFFECPVLFEYHENPELLGTPDFLPMSRFPRYHENPEFASTPEFFQCPVFPGYHVKS